jgi:hypothetical protein
MFAADNPARLTAPSPEIGEGWGGVLYNPCVVFFFQIGITIWLVLLVIGFPITYYPLPITDLHRYDNCSNGHNITYFPPTPSTAAENAHLVLQSWDTGQN